MSRQRQPAPMPPVVASWVLIWFGTILAVNPNASLGQFGAGLWATGVLVQYIVGVRWLIGRPASGPPSQPRTRRVTLRV